MGLGIPRTFLAKLARELPARNIAHPTGDPNARPYLRRYYLCTILGIRVYLHHFIDSDPDGLHNHPWLTGGSILLAGFYHEQRRWCFIKPRLIRFINFVGGDDLHRVIIPVELCAVSVNLDGYRYEYVVDKPHLGVWTLFWHSEKVMPWGTLKDKGAFTQYVSEEPEYKMKKGHSTWHLTAPKGKDLFKS